MESSFPHGGNVRANGIRQHYLRYGGQGPVVIIVPGITSPAPTWSFVAERFGAAFDTYVLDVRGRGLSEASEHLDYGLDAMAADIPAFAAALGLSEYALVGHSMGARNILRAVSRHGAEASRMVMVDPPVSGPGRRAYPSSLPWYVDSIRLSLQGMDVEAMKAFCPTWSEPHLRLRAEWLHTCDERAIVKAYEGFHQDDIHADFARISCPAMLMIAGKGGVILPEDEAEIAALNPALHMVRVDDAGHMIPWDDEEGFYRAFGGFLGKPL